MDGESSFVRQAWWHSTPPLPSHHAALIRGTCHAASFHHNGCIPLQARVSQSSSANVPGWWEGTPRPPSHARTALRAVGWTWTAASVTKRREARHIVRSSQFESSRVESSRANLRWRDDHHFIRRPDRQIGRIEASEYSVRSTTSVLGRQTTSLPPPHLVLALHTMVGRSAWSVHPIPSSPHNSVHFRPNPVAIISPRSSNDQGNPEIPTLLHTDLRGTIGQSSLWRACADACMPACNPLFPLKIATTNTFPPLRGGRYRDEFTHLSALVLWQAPFRGA